MKNTGFNNEWVKTVNRDEFISFGRLHSDWTIEELAAYYDELMGVDTLVIDEVEEEIVKPQQNDSGGNESEVSGDTGSDIGESAGNDTGAEGLPDRTCDRPAI